MSLDYFFHGSLSIYLHQLCSLLHMSVYNTLFSEDHLLVMQLLTVMYCCAI